MRGTHYPQLYIGAFRFAPNVSSLLTRYATLPIPDGWLRPLERLAHANRQSLGQADDRPVRIKISSLNQALLALVPDLISIEAYSGAIERGEWLYSQEPVEPPVVHRIVRAWVRSVYSAAPPALREEVISALSERDLTWQETDFDLAGWAVNEHGTAVAGGPETAAFRLLPDMIAAQLAKDTPQWQLGGYAFTFRRVPQHPRRSGAELVSWPPRMYAPDAGMSGARPYSPYSILLTISVQTVPYQAWPVIHVDVGVRRWVGTPLEYIPFRRTSAYIMSPTPWIQGSSTSPSLVRAPIRWQYHRIHTDATTAPEAHREARSRSTVRIAQWGSHLPDILATVKPLTPYPNLDGLRDDPLMWLMPRLDGVQVGLAYASGMRPEHGVGAGLMPADRHQLLEQVAWRLAPTFERIPPFQTLPYGSTRTLVEGMSVVSATALTLEPETASSGWPPLTDSTDSYVRVGHALRNEIEVNNDVTLDELRETDDEGDEADLLEEPLPEELPILMETAPEEHTTGLVLDRALGGAERKGVTQDDNQARWRSALDRCLDRPIRFEVYFQSAPVLDAVAAAFTHFLGAAEPMGNALASGKASWRWQLPSREVVLETEPLGAMGRPLSLDGAIPKVRERVQAAVDHRREEVVARLGASTGIVGAAIVELDGPDRFARLEDPKPALRLGLTHAGRCSQFLTPLELPNEGPRLAQRQQAAIRNLEFRARQAVRDLLRQVGVQVTLPHVRFAGVTLPDPLNLVGVWMVRRTRRGSATMQGHLVPVLVYMRSDSPAIYATAYGMRERQGGSNSRAWLPYKDALVALGQQQYYALDKPVEAMEYFQRLLERELRGDTLVLVQAQNFRSAWKWLTNPRISQDRVSFSSLFGPDPVTAWPGLRIVRVRSSDQHETPECYGYRADTGRFGFPSSLYSMGDRVFASTYGKPKSFQHAMPSLSRFQPWRSAKGRFYHAAPRTPAWNPQLLELAVACVQPGDAYWPWAALAHELRAGYAAYDDALALPLPLHLAAQLAEYIAPLDGLWREADDESDTEADQEVDGSDGLPADDAL